MKIKDLLKGFYNPDGRFLEFENIPVRFQTKREVRRLLKNGWTFCGLSSTFIELEKNDIILTIYY